MQFNQVQLRAIAFVLAETIFRKSRAEVAHNRVARDFRDHAGRGDAEAETIAIHDRRLRQRKRKNRKAIDQDMLGPQPQRFDRGAHRLVSRAENIDRIDLDGIDYAHGPRDRNVSDQLVVNLLATFRQQLLGIVQPAMLEFFRQNNGCRDDGTGQRAAPCFIHAGDGGDAEGAQFAFIPETTASIH
jgi:hypothetical protein